MLRGCFRFVHPCYVYTAQFQPATPADDVRLVLTGGYDGLLRVWEREVRDGP